MTRSTHIAAATAANDPDRRSLRPDVRNPLTSLPAAAAIERLPPEATAALRALLLDIRRDAAQRAQACWDRRKAPMAAYWKAVSVYAGHTARLLRRHGAPEGACIVAVGEILGVCARLGVGDDEPINGSDAVDALAEIQARARAAARRVSRQGRDGAARRAA